MDKEIETRTLRRISWRIVPFIMLLMLLLAFSQAREPYQPRRPFEVIGGRREAA